MRSETEADREDNRIEPGFTKCEQTVPVGDYPSPTYEELVALEKALFGESHEIEEDEQLEWGEIGPNNFLIKTLKSSLQTATHAVEQQLKSVEKDLQQAKKVFYG